MEWGQIKTESRNQYSSNIDTLTTTEMVRIINSEDKKVALAVEAVLPQVVSAVDIITEQLKKNGRLVYIGCGTSGRLGVLDAAECPPTYSTDPGQIIGIIAGGKDAMFSAVENAEDDASLGAQDLKDINFCHRDVLVGIAASGRTPYVIGAMEYAKSCGAHVIGLTCCTDSEVEDLAEIAILPIPGPEVIAGSTRMKCATAQKMVLNMLSTCAMVKLGKVYGNLMVDVKASNQKLVHRCIRIVSEATNVSENEADTVLKQCEYRPKVAIVMIKCKVDANKAQELLDKNQGRISGALNDKN